MAHHTLPVLHSPYFSQVLNQALRQELARIDQLMERPLLTQCEAVSPSRGRYDDEGGEPCCTTDATVFDLASEQEFCLRHFEELQ